MQPIHAPAAASVPNVPYPSLVADVIPSLHDMEEFLERMLDALERVPVWSTATTNHEPLLHTVAEVKAKVGEWRRSIVQTLQTKWMAAVAEYQTYKQQVDVVLRRRHSAEVQFLFPSLKTAERESQLDPTAAMMMSEEERAVRQHLATLSFGYDKTAEGVGRRVSKLVRRQEKERAVFEATIHHHSDQLLAAKKSDLQRLQREMARSEKLLNSIVASVEGKMAAAARMQSSTLYHNAQAVGGSTTMSQSGRLGSPRKPGQLSPPRSASTRGAVAPVPPPSRHGTNSARSDRSNTTQMHAVLPHRPGV